jgi:two-component system, sensor histidine kinase and response regulator
MNLKTIAKDSKSNFKMTLLFFLLAIAIESLMFIHWKLVLEPRIRVEADANAQILAESQARLISQNLLTKQGSLQLKSANKIINRTLLLNDPILNKPFFMGVSIEIDPDVVNEIIYAEEGKGAAKELFISQGATNCPPCFVVDVGLYSHFSNELIGLAHFQVNDALFQKFKSDIKNKLLVEAFIVLIVAMLVWLAAVNLVKQLQTQISVRKAVEVELRKAKELAEAASETKGQFLANMSHELRTPLNAVIGMGYLVLKGDLSAKQRDHMQKMDSSAHLLLNLINDILDFSKSESGKLELENISFTVDDILANLHKLIVCKAEEKLIEVVFSVDKSVPQNLIGDPLRLGQVLLNLCTNAIKFTEKGTIVIAIEPIQTQSHRITLKFSVTDTGIGLDEEQQNKLFQSFSQVDSSTTRMYGGSGLGLAISKQLTELMGGEIGVDSQLGVGSTFSFSAIFGLGEAINKNQMISVELNHLPVLVIDDNLIALEVITEMLASFSFDVYAASSAEKGLEILDEMNNKNQAIKLIFMDWRLPGINGIEAARLIKERKDLHFMPNIILITAYTHDIIIDSARTYLDAYLPKPLTHSYLCDAIVSLFADTANKTVPVISASKKENNFLCPDVKILLVDDNVINQEVAVAILEETKMQIDVANNGYEAIEKVSENNYDLVLMDIQMPEMDGLEATQIIREGCDQNQLPIIAMTAHAMQKDKDICLSAGMNEYIAKPFIVDEFFATIKKCLPKAKIENNSIAIKNESIENTETYITNLSLLEKACFGLDRIGIDIKQVFSRFKGDNCLLLRLLNQFIIKKDSVITEISDYINNNDWEQAARIVHGLKGTSGNLSANGVYDLTIKLESCFKQQPEQLSKQQANNLCHELLKQMSVEFELIAASLTKMNAMHAANKASEDTITEYIPVSMDNIDVVAIQELVKQLKTLILENNLGAKMLVKELNASLKYPEFDQDLKQLNLHLANLEFDLAEESIQNISHALGEVSS